MKKFSLLIGALGGALGGYLLSNEKLRESLVNAKDPETAARLLGKSLQHDGKKIAKEVKTFVESDDVQANLKKAKKFALQQVNEAKKQVHSFVKKGTKAVKSNVRKAKNSKAFKSVSVS